MTTTKKSGSANKVLMDRAAIASALEHLAAQIHGELKPENLLILGIRTRGVVLAERLRILLEKKFKRAIPFGTLDIAFYRDDLSRTGPNPMIHGSALPPSVEDLNIILVDDVLYTGRTIRAAMNEISDFGRPSMIRLVALVDRGLRELPIQPDYCSLRIATKAGETVHVMLEETDGEEQVVLRKL